jgi:hypothetical protein
MNDVAVLGIGLELQALWPDAPAVTRLPVPTGGGDEDLVALVDAFEAALADHRRAVVVLPEHTGEEAHRHLQTARALMDTERVAIVRPDLPPLAAGVATALAAATAPHLRGGAVLAQVFDQIAGELVVAAWLGRVSGLRRPSPSVGQHVRSLVPGAGFLAVLQPEELVRPLKAEDTPADLPLPATAADRPRELLMAPHPGTDVDWVTERANPALGDLRLRELDPTAAGASWWGTDRLIELVAYPTDVEALARRVAPTTLQRCGWCREPIAQQPCPFCGHGLSTAAAGTTRAA